MTLPLAFILLGSLLVYAGWTNRSVRSLLTGDAKPGTGGASAVFGDFSDPARPNLGGGNFPPNPSGIPSGAERLISGARSNIVSLGRVLQGLGFDVGEHPAFGGNWRYGHDPDGYHPKAMAVDVNWPGGGRVETVVLQWLYRLLKGLGIGDEVLLEDVGTSNQHLHVAIIPRGAAAGGR